MTLAEVQAVVPPVRFGHADKFGVIKTTINPHFDPAFDKTAFADVRSVSFDFLDGRLVTLWIGYEETVEWPPLTDFVGTLSKSLGVTGDWQPRQGGRLLVCEGFSVFAATIAGAPSIRLTDEQAQDVIAARREQIAAAAEAEIIGDRRNNSYYPSDCPAGQEVPAAARVIFKNKEEAEKAGYKIAKDCP